MNIHACCKKNHIFSDYLGFSHFTTSQLKEPRFSYFNAILAIRAAHKIKMFTWGFKSCDSGFSP
jgi:hypothetical protein